MKPSGDEKSQNNFPALKSEVEMTQGKHKTCQLDYSVMEKMKQMSRID